VGLIDIGSLQTWWVSKHFIWAALQRLGDAHCALPSTAYTAFWIVCRECQDGDTGLVACWHIGTILQADNTTL